MDIIKHEQEQEKERVLNLIIVTLSETLWLKFVILMKEVKTWVLFNRNLLLPLLGMNDSRTLDIVKLTQSEIENVRELLEGVDVARDVTKAARCSSKEDYLGTVKIEYLNDKSHASKQIKTYATIITL